MKDREIALRSSLGREQRRCFLYSQKKGLLSLPSSITDHRFRAGARRHLADPGRIARRGYFVKSLRQLWGALYRTSFGSSQDHEDKGRKRRGEISPADPGTARMRSLPVCRASVRREMLMRLVPGFGASKGF